MKNFVQNGANLTITAGSAISSGDFVVVGSLVGVAVTDIANGEDGVISTEGVFQGTKASGATLAVGDVAYLNSSGKLTNTATSNDAVGLVVAVTSTTVDVDVSTVANVEDKFFKRASSGAAADAEALPLQPVRVAGRDDGHGVRQRLAFGV